MNKLKYHFLGGLVFLGTIVFGYIGYTAYTNLATQADGATITQTIWNDVINKVNTIGNTYAPTGAIMAFYLSSCPTGRIIADGTNGTPDLRGEFIRGLDSGRGVDTSRTLGSWQKPSIFPKEVGNKNLSYGIDVSDANLSAIGGEVINTINGYPNSTLPTSVTMVGAANNGTFITSTYNGGNNISRGYVSRPRNVALLYCMKQ